jgi:hypothetical protein
MFACEIELNFYMADESDIRGLTCISFIVLTHKGKLVPSVDGFRDEQ